MAWPSASRGRIQGDVRSRVGILFVLSMPCEKSTDSKTTRCLQFGEDLGAGHICFWRNTPSREPYRQVLRFRMPSIQAKTIGHVLHRGPECVCVCSNSWARKKCPFSILGRENGRAGERRWWRVGPPTTVVDAGILRLSLVEDAIGRKSQD